MGKLHDQLKKYGYEGHPLEVFLVRLLFCLFADDTTIFEKDTFKEFIEVKTNEDGSDLGALLAQFFQVLNTPTHKRLKNLDEHLNAFPYVNGKLFEESLLIPAFDSKMREILLKCSTLDWGEISPAIFGSMFQSVMNPEERRNLGAHYTSEKNILKLIQPLFLDELKEEFSKIKSNKNKLKEFHKKLGTIKFLDPACGCGNFLIISYREIRLLELEVLKILQGKQHVIDIGHIMNVDVDQFFGIECEEFPVRIAEVAMWLMDHQMNLRVSEAFGLYYTRLPLKKSAKIVHGNALTIDWEEVVSKKELSYILGNPPFVGHHYQSKKQKEELKKTFDKIKASGVLDYVSAWYYIAAKYIQDTHINVGFVSTNSITQGEQVSILWGSLLNDFNVKIHFAHRTFSWTNEAKGKAAVHVVIIGFASFDTKNKRLFEYEDIKGEPHEIKANNINPYLVDALDSLVFNRSEPICNVPKMRYGSKPTDGGNFLFSENEKNEFVAKYPAAKKYLRTFLSAKEFLNNTNRYCLWLVDADQKDISSIQEIKKRVEAVKNFRLQSKAESTRNYPYHTLFRQVTQPQSRYIMIPSTTSSRRKYIPFGYLDKNIILSNASFAIENTNFFHFGIISSVMHMVWVKYTCGRLKNDYRYSKDIVYNNFPWPKEPSEKNKKSVEQKAQKILDVRAEFPNSSLADLYDPLIMPPKLVKAHKELDKAVDKCYRPQVFTNETVRIEYLFKLYNNYIEQIEK